MAIFNLRRRMSTILLLAFLLILVAIVILIIIFFKRRRDNGHNVMEVFLNDRFKELDLTKIISIRDHNRLIIKDDIVLTELKQIPEQYNIPSLKHFRSYNPSVFTIYEPELLFKQTGYNGDDRDALLHRLHEFTNHPFYVYRMCNFCQCPGKRLQWDKHNRELTISKTIIQNPYGELFIVNHAELSQNKCEQGCEDARPFIYQGRLYLVGNSTSGKNCRREMIIMEFDLLEFLSSPVEPEFAERTLDAGKSKQKSLINGNRTYIREVSPLRLEKMIYEDQRDQKNWMPVTLKDRDGQEGLYFVYSINPHILLKYQDGRISKIAETKSKHLPDNLRGGSQIIWTKKWHSLGKTSNPNNNTTNEQYRSEDLCVGLIHTREGDQTYTTYIYAFETSYPYRVKYITNGFLFGDKTSHSKKIQFAAGLARIVLDKIAYFYMTYGEHDCDSKLCIMKEEIAMNALLPLDKFKAERY